MLAADTRGLGKHSDYVLIVFVLSLSWVESGSEESFINLSKIKLHSDSQMQKYFEVLLYLCHWVYLGIIVIAADPGANNGDICLSSNPRVPSLIITLTLSDHSK